MTNRFLDFEVIEIDSLFVFVAVLSAEIYKYLFLRPFWPPSWKVAFASYCHYRGSIPWPRYYRNRLFICLCSWPMSWDIQISVLAAILPPSWKVTFPGYCHYYKGSILWPWYYRNRLLFCLNSWPMTRDITQFVGVNNYPASCSVK